MAKPIIGVTPLWDAEKQSQWMLPNYLEGILRAGGVPVVLPLTTDEAAVAQLAQGCDGFLFTGGQDINPALYGQAVAAECGELSAERDGMEALLFRAAVQRLRKPAFGICRGHQFINVMLGGTMVQDIPGHRQGKPYAAPSHLVKVPADTLLYGLLGKKTLEVNSLHHQAVLQIAPGLVANAVAPDGCVEALHHPGYPWLFSVQWHPEYSVGEPDADRLFQAFVQACK